MAPLNKTTLTRDEEESPSDFLCPIGQDLMVDPVMCRFGLTFDRHSILTWISEHHNTGPLTREPLKASDLVPNNALKLRIKAWCDVHGQDIVFSDASSFAKEKPSPDMPCDRYGTNTNQTDQESSKEDPSFVPSKACLDCSSESALRLEPATNMYRSLHYPFPP